MKLSVVVPTLNESSHIGDCLREVRKTFSGELIVVDGGSEDETRFLADSWGAKVLHSSPGLARQCNLGAKEGTGGVFLFLGADCIVPHFWQESIEQAMNSPYIMGGGFRFEPDEVKWPYPIIRFGGNFRSRYVRMALGDQGLFVKRAAFLHCKGFSETSLIPHALLCHQLKEIGEFVLLPDRVVSSTRKYKERGVFQTAWQHCATYLKFARREL